MFRVWWVFFPGSAFFLVEWRKMGSGGEAWGSGRVGMDSMRVLLSHVVLVAGSSPFRLGGGGQMASFSLLLR